MHIPYRPRTTKGIIAIACGFALLATGGTFALWSSQAQSDGGTIILGDLDIKAVGAVGVYDMSYSGENWGTSTSGSADQRRADQTVDLSTACNQVASGQYLGHPIDISGDYRVAPADTVGIIFPFQVRLEGDNLVATLDIAAANGSTVGDLGGTGGPQYDQTSGGVKVTVYGDTTDAAGVASPNKVIAVNDLSWADFRQRISSGNGIFSGKLQAPPTGQSSGTPDPAIPVIQDPIGSAPNVCVLIEALIPNPINQDLTATAAGGTNELVTDLKGLQVTLQQVRTPGIGHFN